MDHQPIQEGETAFRQGKARSSNPYSVEASQWHDWMDGFDAAASQADNPHRVSPAGDHVRVL